MRSMLVPPCGPLGYSTPTGSAGRRLVRVDHQGVERAEVEEFESDVLGPKASEVGVLGQCAGARLGIAEVVRRLAGLARCEEEDGSWALLGLGCERRIAHDVG